MNEYVEINEDDLRKMANLELISKIEVMFAESESDVLSILVTLASLMGKGIAKGADTMAEFSQMKEILDNLINDTARRFYARPKKQVLHG